MNRIQSLAQELRKIGFAKEAKYLWKIAQEYRTTCMFCGEPWRQCTCGMADSTEQDIRDRQSIIPGLYKPPVTRGTCPICGGAREECACDNCDKCGEETTDCQCPRCKECGELWNPDQQDDTDNCDCDRCSDCDELMDECDCERCELCNELIDDCACERCKACKKLIGDCECDRCEECEKLIDDCNCLRCEECNELMDDCECKRCSYCGELKSNCGCHNESFIGDEDDINYHLSQHDKEGSLINQLGLDLEEFRICVRTDKTAVVDSSILIQKNNQILSNLQQKLSQAQQQNQQDAIDKISNAISQLNQQNDTLSQNPSVYVWPKKALALRDRIVSELKKLNILHLLPGELSVLFKSGQYTTMSINNIENCIFNIERHVKMAEASQGYNLSSRAKKYESYWSFHGSSDSGKEELVIALRVADVDPGHAKIWKAASYVFGAHSITGLGEVAFAMIVNTDSDGDQIDDTWVVSQMQSDICDKFLRMKKGFGEEYNPMERYIGYFLNYDINQEELEVFLNDSNVIFILTKWKDLLMKKISYAARQSDIEHIAMETPEAIRSRINFGNRAKAENIYGDIQRRQGFEDYRIPYIDRGMVRRRANNNKLLKLSNQADVAGNHNLSDEYMKRINISKETR